MNDNKNLRSSENNYFSKKINHELFLRFYQIVNIYGLIYGLIYLYLGVKFTGIILTIFPFLFYPLIKFINHKKFYVSARMLLIFNALFFIYISIIGIKFDIAAEYYYIPAMMIPLLLFDIKHQKEIIIGITMPFIAWLIGYYGPIVAIPKEWYPPAFPVELFRSLNFIGIFVVTAVFLKIYTNYVMALKSKLMKDLEKANSMEKQLELAQRIAKIGNWNLDIVNQKLFWSKEQYRIFDIDETLPEVLIHSYRSSFPAEDLAYADQIIKEAIENKFCFEFEHRIITKNGETKYMRSKGEPILGNDGSVEHVFGTGQDITEQKIMANTLIEQQTQLAASAKMASLGEMAAGIAHEINNPLTIIQGKGNLIIKAINSDKINFEKLKDDVEKIVSTTERITKIIRALANISRNSQADKKELTSVNKIIDEVLELSHERFKVNSVELKFKLEEDIFILCRASEISQVILNMVNNAFDATSTFENRWVEIKVSDTDTHTKIVVMDSGLGIPPEIAAKLMLPFFTTKEVGKGTGLGLNISRRIIAAHGGTFYYDPSAENTSFVIEIPRHKSES